MTIILVLLALLVGLTAGFRLGTRLVRKVLKGLKVKPVAADSTPEDILDSWANMMLEHLRLTAEDIDANGVSDQQETRQKIQALQAGAKAIRASYSK